MMDADRLSFGEELLLGSPVELDSDSGTVCDFNGCLEPARWLVPAAAFCERHRDESVAEIDGFFRWKLPVGALAFDAEWRQIRHDQYAEILRELRLEDGGVCRTPQRVAMLDELVHLAVDSLVRSAGGLP
jgi:hypothetical protein